MKIHPIVDAAPYMERHGKYPRGRGNWLFHLHTTPAMLYRVPEERYTTAVKLAQRRTAFFGGCTLTLCPEVGEEEHCHPCGLILDKQVYVEGQPEATCLWCYLATITPTSWWPHKKQRQHVKFTRRYTDKLQ